VISLRHALAVLLISVGSTAGTQTSPAATDGIFRIHPQRPVEVLRKEALAAQPPKEKGTFRKPDLVELIKLDPTIKLDIRYATSQNFLSTPMYSQARAFMQRPAAEALIQAHRTLKAKGYGLLIHDAYRPWYVTKMFWDATPADKKIFVADPREGSRHNRGCAVDLTLYDLKTGKAVTMPSLYDEMTQRAYANYPGGTEGERRHRALLRAAMETQGFTVYPQEWWHFDYKYWRQYAIMNVKFEQLHAARRNSPSSSRFPQPNAMAILPLVPQNQKLTDNKGTCLGSSAIPNIC
jgi:zinc D-Ala-D-Ala dipeptidase